MYVGSNTVLLHEPTKDSGIRGGNLLALEPLQACIFLCLGNGQTQTALAETERTDNLCILLTLFILVLSHNTKVCHSCGHTLGNVIITKIKHLYGEITALHQKGAFAAAHLDAGLRQQGHCVFKQTAF